MKKITYIASITVLYILNCLQPIIQSIVLSMDYREREIAHVLINNEVYYIQKNLLHRASILSVLSDRSDKGNTFNIMVPNALPKHLNLIISLMLQSSAINYDDYKSNISEIISALKVMMFMSLETKLINNFIKNVLKDYNNMIDHIIELDTHDYSINIILDRYKSHNCNFDDIKNIIDKLSKKPLISSTIKINIVSKLISSTQIAKKFDIILCINSEYSNYGNINDILTVQEKNKNKIWKRPILCLYKKYLGINASELLLDFNYNNHMPHMISEIFVNKKPIELVKYTKNYTKGTYGGNTMMSIITHISKILLGFEFNIKKK